MSKDTAAKSGRKDGGVRKKKLGRGLGALMGEVKREEPLVRQTGSLRGEGSVTAPADVRTAGQAPSADSSNNTDLGPISGVISGLNSLPIASITPLPGQPRTHFDDGALAELAASIEARGVIQPIIVRPKGAGRYQLVAGERRWRAAQKARLHEIPAIVRELDDREVTALALIENLQREDLNPVEEARAYTRLAEEEGMTQAEIAQMVDKSRSHIANFQRLLALPDDVLALVAGNDLSMGHARALIGHDDASSLAKQAVKEQLSVRAVEQLVRGDTDISPVPTMRTGQSAARQPGAADADIAAVQAHLEEFLGLTVRIKSDADPRSGAVTIRYRTLDQLDLVCQRLTGGDI